MKRELTPWLLLLGVSGILIWVSALPLADGATFTAIAALAAFCMLGKPTASALRTPPSGVGIAIAALLALSVGARSLLVASLAWTALLAVMIRPGQRPLRRSLVFVPLLFPWLGEAHALGWWFRWTGAAVTEAVLALSGMDITRDGTLLSVAGHALSVEPACAGLGTMHALLLAGAVAAILARGSERAYWSRVLCLPLIAWTANTLRILLTAVSCRMHFDAVLHEPGHSLLGIVLALCAFLLWRPSDSAPSPATA